MEARLIGWLVTLLMLAAPLAVQTHAEQKVWRIGWLRQAGGADTPGHLDAFRQGLRDLGYVEGQHYHIEHRSGQGHLEPLPAFATELVQLPVDLFLTNGLGGTLAARAATRTLPIVFYAVPEPVERGLVGSLARPGGNLTGVANASLDFGAGKMLELLKEVAPGATRLAVLVNPAFEPYASAFAATRDVAVFQAFQTAAAALAVHVQVMSVRDPATELEEVFAALRHDRVEALYVVGEHLLNMHRTQIVTRVAQSRLPTIYGFPSFVEAGGLMSYGAYAPAMAHRAGHLVGKILQGAQPADLPVEQPTKYYLAINLRTAKALGITIPPSLLILADQVIQ